MDEITGEIGNVLSHNLYQYAFNNPISFSDDEGSWPNIFKAIGKINKTEYGKITIGYSSQGGLTAINFANIKGKLYFRVNIDPTNLIHTHFKSQNYEQDIIELHKLILFLES